MRILSVDFGTSALKMTVMDESGTVLHSVRCAYQYDAEDMRVQIEAETIYAALHKACSQLSAECLRAIDALVVCVFSPCLIAMDRMGDPLYPAINHIDWGATSRPIVPSIRSAKRHSKELMGICLFPAVFLHQYHVAWR